MERRSLFSRLVSVPVLALTAIRAHGFGTPEPSKVKLKIMMKSAWGSDDPTRASFVFNHALALAEGGHDVQIFLTGEATYTMRKATVNAIMPIGWPPLSETLNKLVAKHIPIFS
jgi:predicted peroxiredoxin